MNVFLLNVSVQLTDLDLFHELGSERLTHGDAHRSKLQKHITQQHMQLYVQQHSRTLSPLHRLSHIKLRRRNNTGCVKKSKNNNTNNTEDNLYGAVIMT